MRRIGIALGFLLPAFLLGEPACTSTTPEVIVRVDTDAVVPDNADGDPIPRVPIFDRVEFAIIPSSSTSPCAGCTRTFALDGATLRARALSIGIPADMAGSRVRARLFRHGRSGVPRPRSTAEAVALVPRVTERTQFLLELPTDSLGTSRGTLAEPIALVADDGRASRVGSFGQNAFAACATPPEGTACIPGRFVWAQRFQDPGFEQLVGISTFRIDLHEWSVARFRAAKGQSQMTSASTTWASGNAKCPDEADDALPASCMSPSEARRLCFEAGGRLPSSQEFALLAGGLRGFDYPWGNDAARCTDAVISRWEAPIPPNGILEPQYCSTRALGDYPTGPALVAEAFGRDALRIGQQPPVIGLAGNVAEWVHAALIERCTNESFIVLDPRCDDRISAAGGSFLNPLSSTDLADSLVVDRVRGDSAIGFRCVYDLL